MLLSIEISWVSKDALFKLSTLTELILIDIGLNNHSTHAAQLLQRKMYNYCLSVITILGERPA